MRPLEPQDADLRYQLRLDEAAFVGAPGAPMSVSATVMLTGGGPVTFFGPDGLRVGLRLFPPSTESAARAAVKKALGKRPTAFADRRADSGEVELRPGARHRFSFLLEPELLSEAGVVAEIDLVREGKYWFGAHGRPVARMRLGHAPVMVAESFDAAAFAVTTAAQFARTEARLSDLALLAIEAARDRSGGADPTDDGGA